VRVDTHLQAGATVPPYYDSLLAKVIARGTDRAHALAVLRGALDRCAVDGVTTNLGLYRALLADPEFAAGGVDTGYLARWLAHGPSSPAPAGPARNGYGYGDGADTAAVVGDRVADAAPESAASAPGDHGAGAEQAAPVRDRLDLDPGASELGASDPGSSANG
jgi:acetyl/propionyl-CoA carboxylase alpha subunit